MLFTWGAICAGESAARTVRAALNQFETRCRTQAPAQIMVFRFVDNVERVGLVAGGRGLGWASPGTWGCAWVGWAAVYDSGDAEEPQMQWADGSRARHETTNAAMVCTASQ